MINNLTKVHPTELGGFRIEIRLKARTLNQARVTARSLPFFSIDSWLNPTEDEIKPFKLEAMAITKEDLLRNVVQMLAIAILGTSGQMQTKARFRVTANKL